jgi:hypothetical protein
MINSSPMLTPEQFTSRWQSEVVAKDTLPEDVKLLTLPAQRLATCKIPDSARQFLVEAGLPNACAPFLGFEEVGKGLPRIWERYAPGQWQPDEKIGLEHYVLIGYEDNAGNPICLDELDGRVVTVEHELLFDPRARERRIMFVNSSIPQLAECLLLYQTSSPQDRLAALAQIDPPAIRKGAFWFAVAPHDVQKDHAEAAGSHTKPWWKFW